MLQGLISTSNIALYRYQCKLKFPYTVQYTSQFFLYKSNFFLFVPMYCVYFFCIFSKVRPREKNVQLLFAPPRFHFNAFLKLGSPPNKIAQKLVFYLYDQVSNHIKVICIYPSRFLTYMIHQMQYIIWRTYDQYLKIETLNCIDKLLAKNHRVV